LVRRVKYRDWALPKGKLKRGETFEHAALREVREETGCAPKLREFVGLVHYLVKKEPKVVLYWNMTCARRSSYRPNEEIAKVVWLTPGRALRRMSYAGERKILRAALKLRS
jgi:8-oxo-dGTP diphosphatase